MNKEVILKNLRSVMASHKAYAYIITGSDEHNNEYLAACEKRLTFLTGFTGSAGLVVVTNTDVALLTDTRYTLQAKRELSKEWKIIDDGCSSLESIQKLQLLINLPIRSNIAIDSKYISHQISKRLRSHFKSFLIDLYFTDVSFIDIVWFDRPCPPSNPIFCYDSVVKADQKITMVRDVLAKKNIFFHVVTELDNIAWLLNLRGNDIEYNPLFFSYLIISMETLQLFVDKTKLSDSVNVHLKSIGCETCDYGVSNVVNFVKEMSKNSFDNVRRVLLSGNTNEFLISNISKIECFEVVIGESPISGLKVIKTGPELVEIRECHIRDSVAICAYFNWLERAVCNQTVTEISGAAKLLEFRRKMDGFQGPSFQTISSVGENAALVHYHPEQSTNVLINLNEVYLCDSGGHYLDGTTDVTRTICLGKASPEVIVSYTLVLKGFINLHSTSFPDKTYPSTLDSIARRPLWFYGYDYGHGTGHGVGTYLCVHEKPIIGRAYPDEYPIQEGMVLTIEPGHYRENFYGIRIENVTEVVLSNIPAKEKKSLTFQSLTYVPFQRSLIDKTMLSQREITFVNKYHEQCREKLIGYIKQNPTIDLGPKIQEWITNETASL